MIHKLKALLHWGNRLLRNLADSVRYRLRADRCPPASPRNVVFVCKGNVCRSAYAEYFMRTLSSPDSLNVASCGLDVRRSDAAPPEARRVAARKGLDLDGHRSKSYEACDLGQADLILAMEFWQYRMLAEMLPHKQQSIRLLREYAPFPENLLCNISDPFGRSESTFERCFAQIERAVVPICRECTGNGRGMQ
ncbi:MAG: hypothetical protein A2X80_05100 [Geobacteraceae bacterium GWB2_52_12]|nr:MAG: hypothetical protein A2X80_05100 [Geobacteraceae bacterium GWB2_52_12]